MISLCQQCRTKPVCTSVLSEQNSILLTDQLGIIWRFIKKNGGMGAKLEGTGTDKTKRWGNIHNNLQQISLHKGTSEGK